MFTLAFVSPTYRLLKIIFLVFHVRLWWDQIYLRGTPPLIYKKLFMLQTSQAGISLSTRLTLYIPVWTQITTATACSDEARKSIVVWPVRLVIKPGNQWAFLHTRVFRLNFCAFFKIVFRLNVWNKVWLQLFLDIYTFCYMTQNKQLKFPPKYVIECSDDVF